MNRLTIAPLRCGTQALLGNLYSDGTGVFQDQ